MNPTHDAAASRVLILAPVGRDAELACRILQSEQLTGVVCPDIECLLARIEAGAGTALIAEEAVRGKFSVISDWVQRQPAWSDFPFILLTGRTAAGESGQHWLRTGHAFGNVTVLERPLRSFTLVTVVMAALRARARQYEVAHYIEQIQRAEAARVQAYARETAAHAQMELLNHIGVILSAEVDLDALLPAILKAGADVSGADVGIFLAQQIGDRTGKPEVRCASGISVTAAEALLNSNAISHMPSMSQGVLRHPSDRVDPNESGWWIQRIAETASLLGCIALPVASRRDAELLGIMILGRYGTETFSDREVRIVSTLASQAAIAIDNARLFSMAEQEKQRLEAARQVLQRSNEELRQFAYIASHDLQEPLRTVASLSQVLVNRYQGHDRADAEECVRLIVDGVERMSCLIQDLLEYSYCANAKAVPSSPCSAEDALREVESMLTASIQESGAVLTHDPLPNVWIERREMMLLFQNLIGNAIKYRGQHPLKVHVWAESVGADWVFSVRDNGIGIPRQYHDRIFKLFKRLHGKEIPGTGIGLAICERIVEWQNGKIWVESELGVGSTFHFKLPKEPQRMQLDMAEFAASAINP
jgi:signal transduction histidine kinase